MEQHALGYEVIAGCNQALIVPFRLVSFLGLEWQNEQATVLSDVRSNAVWVLFLEEIVVLPGLRNSGDHVSVFLALLAVDLLQSKLLVGIGSTNQGVVLIRDLRELDVRGKNLLVEDHDHRLLEAQNKLLDLESV